MAEIKIETPYEVRQREAREQEAKERGEAMETDATEANKEKTPEEIEQERAKLTAESNNNYVKALEAEGALINSIETALSGVS